MTKYKYISTTLPYLNSRPHIGHAFEFVLADVIAEYHRFLGYDVLFNVGVDEHGQKIQQQAEKYGMGHDIQGYCDENIGQWFDFCEIFDISYDNFYRTTNKVHAAHVLRYVEAVQHYIYSKEYTGKYCVGCEAYITDKEAVNGKCPTHNTKLEENSEVNKFFRLKLFSDKVKDILVDKSKSKELANILKDDFDLSITRKNVDWGVRTEDGETLYVWFEALLNYIFAAGYYTDKEKFANYWGNSLIICGKDNLKFQAYILQALLLANDVPQTSEVLVHGTILDEKGDKMSKSVGNVIDPRAEFTKYGTDPVRYYLTFGLNTTGDSRYSEVDLVKKWNTEIVGGLGNLISRALHLIDLRGVEIDVNEMRGSDWQTTNQEFININNRAWEINAAFETYNFAEANKLLVRSVNALNARISNEKPYDKGCENYSKILNEIHYELTTIIPFYGFVLKQHASQLEDAFKYNEKVILFKALD